MWEFPVISVGGSHDKNYSSVGSIFGSSYFGKLPCMYVCMYVCM